MKASCTERALRIHRLCAITMLTLLDCGLEKNNKKKQRMSGPVNALTHLTPGPCIYFNAFIHVLPCNFNIGDYFEVSEISLLYVS